MQPQTITVELNIKLQWRLERTARGAYVGVCDAIGLALEADSEPELREVVAEGLHFFLLGHLEDGTLEGYLRSKGWTSNQPLPRGTLRGDDVRFNVPWELQPVHAA